MKDKFLTYTALLRSRLNSCETILIAVNALFVAKYSARVTELWPYVTFAWILLMALFIAFILPWMLSKPLMRRFMTFAFPVVIIGMVALQYSIDPYSIQVDRWSALHFPIENMLNGIYPYIAETHLGGYASPFPVWQILHIPFYLIGNVGLSIIFAILFFLWTIYRYQGKSSFLMAFVFLTISPALWYEIAVRSDLITNFLLLGAVVNIICNKISSAWIENNYIALSVIIGLFASTRLLTLLPFAILFLPYYFNLKSSQKIIIPIIFFTVFLITFVPFALWDFNAFFYHEYNPWSLQTRQGNLLDFIIYIPVTFALALTWKENFYAYYRNSALFVICFVAISMLHNMYESDNWELFSSAYDITYYNTVIPFVILSSCNRKIKNIL